METKIEISNNWRNKIRIKNLFEDETTPELIATLCSSLIVQLKAIEKREEKSNLDKDEKHFIDSEINDLIGHFEFLRELANGTIKESEWENYDFNGDYEAWFNDYLSQLYDLGDKRVITSKGVSEKFIWIE